MIEELVTFFKCFKSIVELINQFNQNIFSNTFTFAKKSGLSEQHNQYFFQFDRF